MSDAAVSSDDHTAHLSRCDARRTPRNGLGAVRCRQPRAAHRPRADTTHGRRPTRSKASSPHGTGASSRCLSRRCRPHALRPRSAMRSRTSLPARRKTAISRWPRRHPTARCAWRSSTMHGFARCSTRRREWTCAGSASSSKAISRDRPTAAGAGARRRSTLPASCAPHRVRPSPSVPPRPMRRRTSSCSRYRVGASRVPRAFASMSAARRPRCSRTRTSARAWSSWPARRGTGRARPRPPGRVRSTCTPLRPHASRARAVPARGARCALPCGFWRSHCACTYSPAPANGHGCGGRITPRDPSSLRWPRPPRPTSSPPGWRPRARSRAATPCSVTAPAALPTTMRFPCLARAAPALASLPAGALRSLRYADGHVVVELQKQDAAQSARTQRELQRAGLVAIMAPTATGARIRIGLD